MTAETRNLLKGLVDRRVRELRADDEELCRGCGADWASRTVGCRTCMDRHYNRNNRSRLIRVCVGCGCRYSERTPGCTNCRNRHNKRRRNPELVEAA